ncbi:MAG: M24 family metallopeptidase [Xanthomonadales bacterium]|nr:M24 family metallopeptidase [Xanthomonadales bacterium]
MKIYTIIFSLLLSTTAFAADQPRVLSMHERAETIDRLLEDKLKTTLPELMRREGFDMWIVMSREYNEDPVIKTMLPATWLAARRRTILVMFDPGAGQEIETLAVARYDVGTVFKRAWEPEQQPDQWKRLAETIVERDPQKIGVNFSAHWGLADGVSATDFREFKESLPGKYQQRVVSAEKLSIAWLETRTSLEMALYPEICRIAHDIIAEGFSAAVIEAGVTTTADVVWWYRERIRELKLTTWFHPSVAVQRQDPESFDHMRSFASRPEENVIQPGDLLHVDFGITYLRLNTDTQQHAYVLKPDETRAPQYLEAALQKANRLQDILMANFKAGKTGNEVLKESREQAIAEGIKPSIYSHPIGYHGHGAGAAIGRWDAQEGLPFTGDYPMYLDTAYSIELNAATFIEEWDKEIRIMLEEDAYFDETGVHYIDGRQTEFILIDGQKGESL